MIKRVSMKTSRLNPLVLRFQTSVVMETSKPPLTTSESHLNNSSAGPKTNASYPNLNNMMALAIITEDIVYISFISCTEIPMICLAIYAVYFLIKSNQAALLAYYSEPLASTG